MPEVSVGQLRMAARLANGFALDLVKLGGYGRDVVDGLILAVISQANVAQITRSPEVQRRYAFIDTVPPDELRRPVSINAVAGSLRLPFETVRRRIALLKTAGIVQVTPRGVIVPQGPLNSPFYRIGAEANYDLVRELYRRLSAIGMFEDLVRAPPAYDAENRPVRLVIRLSSDYLLRLAEPITEHVGDLLRGLIFMDVVAANTEHLADVEGEEGLQGAVRDELRRPVRIPALSARLGIPLETVRRHLNKLIAEDRLERVADGYLVPARVASRRLFVDYVLANHTAVTRLFQGLAEYGVVATWDQEDQALRGAA